MKKETTILLECPPYFLHYGGMKSIISWNVNGIRAAEKKGFLDWLKKEAPDILCLQETKAEKGQLPPALTEPEFENGVKYKTWWSSAEKKGYSGTAVFCRETPLAVEKMGVKDFDREGRITATHFDEFSVISAYFPNSQEGGARLQYKLEFCAAIKEYCDKLVLSGRNIILCGDYNIAHKAIDLANPKSNEKNPGYLPEERAWMDTFTGAGYTDTFRSFCGEPGMYSWWSYRFKAREKNIGWRIDYHCVNQGFMREVKNSLILSDVQGSDHCPVKLELK